MRYLFILLLLLNGCVAVQRHSSAAAHTYLEAKALDYQHTQDMRIHEVAYRLMQQIPDPPEVNIYMVPNPTPYAGTTEGKLIVTTGMVKFVQSDDELAMVIGHELAHHTQGHIRNAQTASVAITILAVFANHYAPGSGRAVQAIGSGLYNHYNQSQELEADAVGLQYAAAAGYDPRAGAAVWERFAIEIPQTLSASFFDSHPSSPERMQAAQEQASLLIARGYTPTPHLALPPSEQPHMQPVAAIATAPSVPSSSEQAHIPTVAAVTMAPSVPSSRVGGGSPLPVSYGSSLVSTPYTHASSSKSPYQWHVLNIVSLADLQFRAAECDYHAGRISLEELHRVRKELYGS